MLILCTVVSLVFVAATLGATGKQIAVATTAAPVTYPVRLCSTSVRRGLIVVTSVRGGTCAAAARDIALVKVIARTFRTGDGYSCVRQPVGTEWRCVRGARAYRFSVHD